MSTAQLDTHLDRPISNIAEHIAMLASHPKVTIHFSYCDTEGK